MFVGSSPPLPYAAGPGSRARRLRAVAERAGRVDLGQRAAARADRQHLDRREADRVAVLDEPLVRGAELAVVDEADVGARAAHVDADHVLVAAQRGRVPRRHGARRDAGRGEPDGELLHRLRGHHAAAGVQDQQVAVVAVVLQALVEVVDVGGDERRQDRVGDGRGEALVLEQLGQDAGRGGDRRVGELLAQDLGHALLVVAVGVGVDEAHRDGLDLAPGQDPRDLLRLRPRRGLRGPCRCGRRVRSPRAGHAAGCTARRCPCTRPTGRRACRGRSPPRRGSPSCTPSPPSAGGA